MSSNEKKIPLGVQYIIGGLAGMGGTFVVHPADLVKTRMQLQEGNIKYKNSIDCIKYIYKNGGFFGFYKGMSGGLLRQATYATARFGTYTNLVERYKKLRNENPNLLISMVMAGFSGGIGAFIGNPADVCLIRMMADGQLPKNEQRHYKGVRNALFRITKEEGFLTLYRGCVPTMIRAVVFNMLQITSYFHAKTMLMEKFHQPEGVLLHTYASLISGLLTSVGSFPVDVAKTRIQNMLTIDGKPEYTGTFNVITKLVKNHGFLHIYKGLGPYYSRVAPHTLIIFVLLEQLNRLYLKYVD